MTFVSGLLLYAMVWTVVIFMVLPFCIQTPDRIEKGHASSAPHNPQIGKKIVISLLLSAIIWAALYWFLTSDATAPLR